ncbi:2-oxoacid:ferredoxin oxidoreductase subunit beta [Thermopolyspora sp. NPDC052614]|uniref:2-oxoacid:ferredoxin oxidoreductase subunit beta n=1 Tax=Thermopolyspora sp. NPDC052614 TaxID=3155682 RepID=UPI003416BED0
MSESLNGKGLRLVPKTDAKQTLKDFKSDQEVRWCPGCGDYAILAAVQSFLPELGLKRENIVFISGIGCSSRFPYYMNTYGFHSIHGRAPAIATGLAASRPDLSVWVITGDGDSLSIGGNHLIHALRRNINLNILLFNNRIYGLTKGQYSPTSEIGKITKSTPMGSLDRPFNPISLALGAEAGFVARTIDSDRKHLQSVLREAAAHRGTSLVEIYQNCNIFNDNAFEQLKDPEVRDDITLRLEHGQPIVSATKAVRRGPNGGIEVVDRATVAPEEILVHDAHNPDPSVAFALSRLDEPAFEHVPIGIFRSVDRPSYDELLNEQVDKAVAAKGRGELRDLLLAGDTWRIN